MAYEGIVTQTTPGCPFKCTVSVDKPEFLFIPPVGDNDSIFEYRSNNFAHGETGTYTLTCESKDSTHANREADINVVVLATFECASINPPSFSSFSVLVGATMSENINLATPTSATNCTNANNPFTYIISSAFPSNVESTDIQIDISNAPTSYAIVASPDNADDAAAVNIVLRACYTWFF